MSLENDFYAGIEHTPVPWREYLLHVPVFYPRFRLFSASLLAPIQHIRAILPSSRLQPYRILPGKTLLTITAYEYQDCDLGPYNEVMIGIPVTLDQPTPQFTGLFRRPPSPIMSFSHILPVTTQIALDVGKEFAGYPKFLAQIAVEDNQSWLDCELKLDGGRILSMKGRRLSGQTFPRAVVHPLTFREGVILRSELILSRRQGGTSRKQDDFILEWGDHALADELQALNPGKMVSCMYAENVSGILTPVIESYHE